MKYKIFFILLICFLLPFQATASISKKCHLNIDFSFEAPYLVNKDLAGFRLYKDGEKICEVNDPYSRSFACDFQSVRGSYGFTLAPFFSDGSVGSHSPIYSAGIGLNELVVQNIAKLLLDK